jgi:5'-3' exonuclease
VVIDLVDGTYELFRHYHGLRRFRGDKQGPLEAAAAVLTGVLQLIENRVTHVGVATDHVVESFRNQLWAGYKTGEGIEPVLRAQFEPLEQGLAAMGVVVWPMVEVEADDALASAARLADADPRVEKVLVWTPDKDLAQCVRGERVVQVDRRAKAIRTSADIRQKFGVEPALIPDYLALVGDTADGYPGIAGIGPVGAARLLNRHGPIESFPPQVLGGQLEEALLFKRLATLKSDIALFGDVEVLRWRGPKPAFEAWTTRAGAPKLLERAQQAAGAVAQRH